MPHYSNTCLIALSIRAHCGGKMHSHSLQWRHNEHGSVSYHQPHGCLLNRLIKRRSKKTLKLHGTGLCVGNSQETGEFPAQRASNAEDISIWWRHLDWSARTVCFVPHNSNELTGQQRFTTNIYHILTTSYHTSLSQLRCSFSEIPCYHIQEVPNIAFSNLREILRIFTGWCYTS